VTEERLALLERFCQAAGGRSEHQWHEVIANGLRAYANEARKTPPGHEPLTLPGGPLQNYLEVVSPEWVLEVITALREERRRNTRD
jgi:hypothetical protein